MVESLHDLQDTRRECPNDGNESDEKIVLDFINLSYARGWMLGVRRGPLERISVASY